MGGPQNFGVPGAGYGPRDRARSPGPGYGPRGRGTSGAFDLRQKAGIDAGW